MKATAPILFLAGVGLTFAAPEQNSHQRGTPPIFIPDNNFQLTLEDLWYEQCPPIYMPGSDATFSSFSDYTCENAAVDWALMGNMFIPDSWNPPPHPIFSASLRRRASGACCLARAPTGILKACVLYPRFSGEVKSATGTLLPSRQQFPCASRDSNRQCTARNSDYDYTEISYRCTKCSVLPCASATSTSSPTTSAMTPPTFCEFGTVFGYQSAGKPYNLDTQSGQSCKRWPWYRTPSLAGLQGRISGPLYVGAGGNDIPKAIKRRDLDCHGEHGGPGSYAFGRDGLGGVSTFSTTQLQYPSCPSGSRAALIIHAAISQTGMCLVLNA
ncbi:hypothetical protein MMYC01_208040 [Madurella mycetomatis]|uniref:Uncharacterized protein n=1 Tax=Madurella mycetomatis TaxID=100816 RepID=A0A175VU94_9PEZI|nr:hypothetical protein MMYC01_208040 [Madurella mycetomatis]